MMGPLTEAAKLEVYMWALIIIVVMSSVQGISGTSNSISSLQFSSQAKCDAAAAKVAVNGGTIPVNSANGAFQIRAHCVELLFQKTPGGTDDGMQAGVTLSLPRHADSFPARLGNQVRVVPSTETNQKFRRRHVEAGGQGRTGSLTTTPCA
jgi:hypothetical protein